MGGRGGTSLAAQQGHQHHASGAAAQESGDGAAVGHTHAHAHKHGKCGSGFIMQLTGLDLFTKGKAADGLARAGKASNPFDLGIAGNCKDFWMSGRELGVEYERLYDVPAEGFREAKSRREREEEEDMRAGGDRRKGQGLFMGFGLNLGRGSRAGYEPVSQA